MHIYFYKIELLKVKNYIKIFSNFKLFVNLENVKNIIIILRNKITSQIDEY